MYNMPKYAVYAGNRPQESKSTSLPDGIVDMTSSKGVTILGRKGVNPTFQGNGVIHLVFRGRACVSARLASRKSSGAS